jgi:hypothetical protein
MKIIPSAIAAGLRPAFICLIGSLLAAAATAVGAAEPKPSATNSVEAAAGWQSLFDGKSLKGWKVTDFAGHADVVVDPKFRPDPKAPASAAMIFEEGAVMTGVTWTNPPPKGEYEVSLDAMKIDGTDFFGALTFPAGDGHCSLIVGGWGGGLVGISSIDGMDASENETTKYMSFEKNRWYHIRVLVTKKKIEAWIDKEKVANVEIADHRITVRPGEIELAEPFGITAYQTKSAIRDIRLREF